MLSIPTQEKLVHLQGKTLWIIRIFPNDRLDAHQVISALYYAVSVCFLFTYLYVFFLQKALFFRALSGFLWHIGKNCKKPEEYLLDCDRANLV
jgi:hypothetical protein